MPARAALSLAIATLSLGLTAIAPPALAQETAAASSAQAAPATNAALLYWRAWNGRFPTIFDAKYLEQEFRDVNWSPPPAIASVLEGAQGDIQLLMRAARSETCDWGVSLRDEGFETPLPYLAKLRTSARVLLADSRRLAASGDMKGACERLACILLMSRHLRNDKNTYCVMTAQSIAIDIAMREMKRVASGTKLDDESTAILLNALEKVTGPDPFAMRDAIRELPTVLRNSIRRVCHGPDAATLFITKFVPQSTAEERAQSGVQSLNEAELYAAADRLPIMYEEILANWDMPEPVRVARDIDGQRRAGDFGPVAALINSDLSSFRRVVVLAEAQVQEAIRVVKGETANTTPPAK